MNRTTYFELKQTVLPEAKQKSVRKEAINQVKNSIGYMSQGSYKLNGMDFYTPVWYQLHDISDLFNLPDYDFSLDDMDKFEPEDEVEQDLLEVIHRDKDVIGYTPSQKDVDDDKKILDYVHSNFLDSEMLNTFDYWPPKPITNKDMKSIFNQFIKAMKKAKITSIMAKTYKTDIYPYHIANWAD